MLVRPSKQLKQIIEIEHNSVVNHNWPEAKQLVIGKRGRGFEQENEMTVKVMNGLS